MNVVQNHMSHSGPPNTVVYIAVASMILLGTVFGISTVDVCSMKGKYQVLVPHKMGNKVKQMAAGIAHMSTVVTVQSHCRPNLS